MDRAIDQKRVEEFSKRLLGHMNGAAIAQLVSIGHRTGLFDTMADMEPSTSAEIAEAARLNERYVREWLNSMVVSGIVDFAPGAGTYDLPAEHAACLTRSAGLGNMAVMGPFFPMLGAVEPDVIRSFEKGGGVHYSNYRGFHQLMAERSGQRFDALLLDRVLPGVPGLVAELRSGIDLADVGCGSGHAVNLMAAEFPDSRFVGYDFSADAIGTAIAESERLRLSNTQFIELDAAGLDRAESFDFVTMFDAVHDQARPGKALEAVFKSLRPGGGFLMVEPAGTGRVDRDMADPLAIFKYTVSLMHCMTVSLALGGEGLGTMWGEPEARALLEKVGFSEISKRKVDGDAMNDYFFARKS